MGNCLVVVVARGKRVNRRRFMAGFTPVDPLIVFRCFAINLLSSSVISRDGEKALRFVSSLVFLMFFFFFELQGIIRRFFFFLCTFTLSFERRISFM